MDRLGRATWPAQPRGSGEEGASRPNTNSKQISNDQKAENFAPTAHS